MVHHYRYWERLQTVRAADPRLKKAIYLTTYDPNSLKWFQEQCQKDGWKLQYTNFERMDDQEGLETRVRAIWLWLYQIRVIQMLGGARACLKLSTALHAHLLCACWTQLRACSRGVRSSTCAHWFLSCTAVQHYAERLGPTNEALNSLAGLHLALQCDAFVGTQSSNWGRLIDELRATVGCAADKVYLDAAMGDPPGDTDMMKP